MANTTDKDLTLADFKPATTLASVAGGSYLIYGLPGAGKTTFGASGPMPVILDLEGGTDSVADRPDVAVLAVPTLDHLTKAFRFLATAEHPYRTVVVDSLTEVHRQALKAASGGALVPEQQHYNAAMNRVVQIVDSFCKLAYAKGYHLVLTAPEKERTLGTGRGTDTIRIDRRPDLPPATLQVLNQLVHATLRLHIRSEQRVLTLRAPSSLIIAKLRVPLAYNAPAELADPTLPKLLTLLRKDHTP